MSELPFQIALTLLVFLAASVATFYSRRARHSGGPISPSSSPGWETWLVRIAGVLLVVSVALAIIHPNAVPFLKLPLPDFLRWAGLATGLLAWLFMWWTLATLGSNLTSTASTRQDATLVATGPYRRIRHPYYVAAALLMASVTLLSANLVIGLTSAAVLILLALRIPEEEQRLLDAFGDTYRQYQARTPRFFPHCNR